MEGMEQTESTQQLPISLINPAQLTLPKTIENKRKNNHNFSPAQQDSEVPLGWTPTAEKPIAVMRCSFKWPEGHARYPGRCARWSLRGTTVCPMHGGQLPNVQTHAAAMVEAGLLRLIEHSDKFIDGLIELADHSESDAVRLGAMRDGLDRAGIKSGVELNINITAEVNTTELLLGKLKAISSRNQPSSSEDDEITDAEYTENDEPTLF
jgi:hypothetical protein